jgi:hypothetical protein
VPCLALSVGLFCLCAPFFFFVVLSVARFCSQHKLLEDVVSHVPSSRTAADCPATCSLSLNRPLPHCDCAQTPSASPREWRGMMRDHIGERMMIVLFLLPTRHSFWVEEAHKGAFHVW